MTTTKDEVTRWFIERFIPPGAARTFALRHHNLIDAPKLQQRVIDRNSRYQFTVRPFGPWTADKMEWHIIPLHDDAEWLVGKLTWTAGRPPQYTPTMSRPEQAAMRDELIASAHVETA